MEACSYLYLIGHEGEDHFKYGITKNPEKRLKQLRASKYMEYEGFPIDQAKICFLSEPLDRNTARTIELLWPSQCHRPFIGYRYHKYREVVQGELSDLSQSLKLFIRNFDWDNYIHPRCTAWHFFGCNQLTLVYRRESTCQAIELASISECNPFFTHHHSFIGDCGYMWMLNNLYKGRKGAPKQSYTIYEDPVSKVADQLLSIKNLDEYYVRVNQKHFQKPVKLMEYFDI